MRVRIAAGRYCFSEYMVSFLDEPSSFCFGTTVVKANFQCLIHLPVFRQEIMNANQIMKLAIAIITFIRVIVPVPRAHHPYNSDKRELHSILVLLVLLFDCEGYSMRYLDI
jgi:hypothetical protein